MIHSLLQVVEDAAKKKDPPEFSIGDTVTVHVRIVEGDKERIQPFTGVVIARRGRGMGETFTVRRIVNNEGVERVFPLHSPKIAGVEVVRSGHVRRQAGTQVLGHIGSGDVWRNGRAEVGGRRIGDEDDATLAGLGAHDGEVAGAIAEEADRQLRTGTHAEYPGLGRHRRDRDMPVGLELDDHRPPEEVPRVAGRAADGHLLGRRRSHAEDVAGVDPV